jgi:hypothetical protein
MVTPDGNLTAALTALADAVTELTWPRPAQPPRYTALRDAQQGTRNNGHSRTKYLTPGWIDALLLLLEIDDRTKQIHNHYPPTVCHINQRNAHPTIRQLQQIETYPWRPQDTKDLESITAELCCWAKAIDDLFAMKPVYLRGCACPQCGQDHTHRNTNDGTRVWTTALVLNAETGATACQACHATWPFEKARWLGRLLTEKIPA